jgi:glutamate 5-kinase
MSSKVAAAMIATSAGIPVLMTEAAQAAAALARGTAIPVGTAFAPAEHRTSARLFWLRHAASSSGALALDAGAVAAVTERRKSLLPAGITGCRGDFESGDVVDLLAPDGAVVARGLVAHDAAELPAIAGRQLADLPADQRREVVHADDLVSMRRPLGRDAAAARSRHDNEPDERTEGDS